MLQERNEREMWYGNPPEPPRGSSGEASRSPEAMRSGKRVKVLVVDDEPAIADTLVEIFNDECMEALAAPSADAALAALEAFAPDVVLTDVVMPGMNGVQLAIEIRQAFPKCRVILFSGQSATVDLLKEARARGYEFEIVAKPFKPENLIALVRRGRSS